MKQKLKELLEDTLKEWECDVSTETIEQIAEHLIQNGVIVLPCKVGDRVYWIDKETGKIVSARLQEFRMGFCVMTEHGSRGYIPHTSFDDNMFYTKEEAERKLREVGE